MKTEIYFWESTEKNQYTDRDIKVIWTCPAAS